jgi:hypothetical protein
MSEVAIRSTNDIQISSGAQSINIYGNTGTIVNQVQFNTNNNVISTIDISGLTITSGNVLSIGSASNYIRFSSSGSTSGIVCDSLQVIAGSNSSTFSTNGTTTELFTDLINAGTIKSTNSIISFSTQFLGNNQVTMGPTLTNYMTQLISEIVANGS